MPYVPPHEAMQREQDQQREQHHACDAQPYHCALLDVTAVTVQRMVTDIVTTPIPTIIAYANSSRQRCGRIDAVRVQR